MSFARAKIRRFNDIQNDIPAPNAYSPTVQYKIKGYASQRSKRFDEKIISKSGPSGTKPKQMSRRNPKPITQFATASKGHKIPCATETTRPDFEINHVYVLESEIKNLETKISAYLPSMNNKVSDLHEVWSDKKKSLLLGDVEKGKLIDDNMNNILKEMSHMLSNSQKEYFQEISFIQSMNS
ncbi:uncharacterized protein LOC127279779 [Leptopilina boulardi]|uniref:uncharacterized protein LOC127279779 n=1 Tax=Leptopilina boulardi TaxID=63433 RepID=UPI0021F6391C|nr:uncharacterized protein LOC127279779 [Leptopilina boulardi]